MHREFSEDGPQKFIGWTRPLLTASPFTSGLICVKQRGEGGIFNQFKYFEPQELCKWTFALLIVPEVFRERKYFSYFSRLLSMKRQENELYNEIRSPPHSELPASPLSVILVKLRLKCLFWNAGYSWRIFGILTNGNR